jgi:hypothetical protein
MAGAHATTIHVSIAPEFPAVAWYAPCVRIAVLGLLAAFGCSGKPAPAASGSLVFDPQPANVADVYLATEAEVIRSAPLRERIHQEQRLEISADAIVVTRKPGTMILEVGVRDDDPGRAADVCNRLVHAYVDYRREKMLVGTRVQQQALAMELDKHPEDARLQERMRELELTGRILNVDVRLLEPCVAASRR